MAKRSARGLTLVEIIVTICLIAVLAITCLSFMISVTKFSQIREARLAAATAAYSTIEHLREIGRNNFVNAVELTSAGAHNGYTGIVKPGVVTDISYTVTDGHWAEDTIPAHVDYKIITVTCAYLSGSTLTMKGYAVENA